jgi:oligopeptide/dipeptide ABC transporter ATP-binding protein
VSKYFVVRREGARDADVVRALDGVSAYVRPGETLGVIGETGSGKTTLLHTLTGLLEPDYGAIEFDGQDLLALSPRERVPLRRRLQIVLQSPSTSLPSGRSPTFIVAEGLLAHGIEPSAQAREERVRGALDRVGLAPELRERAVHGLSLGDRARIRLARSLVLDPALLVLDDPLSALDPASRAYLAHYLVEVQQARETAFILASHDLALVAHLSQRVAVLYAGCLVETGPTASVFGRPRHPYTQALLGASRSLPIAAAPALPRPLNGCPFQPRCPKAGQGCDTLMPGWVEVSLDHQRVACWFPDA